MDARRRTWFDERGLVVAGAGAAEGPRRVPFVAGAMHYWRVAPERWPACLAALHGLGLTLVDTPVPWAVHEPAPGARDWRGGRDLGRFLDAAGAAGLAVVLRVGPRVGAEVAGEGVPAHVLADPACQARTAHGTPVWLPLPPRAFPVPSYASAAFHARVAAWFEALAEVVAPRLAPDGPVVALVVDGGGPGFHRLGAFDHDYHPDAVAAWRDATGEEGEPPRRWEPSAPARGLGWLRAKDQLAARALGQFAGALEAAGLGGVARCHELPPGPYALADARRLQAALGGPVGLASSPTRAGLTEARRRACALFGDAAPLPLALAAGVGAPAWYPPLDEADDPTRERDHVLHLLAGGVRGLSLCMAVERERFAGAAIDREGRVEPHAAWIRTLTAALAEVDWPALRRPARVALIAPRADARAGLATSALDPVAPALAAALGLGPAGLAELGEDPGAREAARWQAALQRALELAGVPYALVDEAAGEDELARYHAVVAPTGDRVDRGLWRRLRALAEHRRAVVVIGPGTPSRDELDQPLADAAPRRMGRIRAGSLDDLPGLAQDLAGLAGEPPAAWLIERPDEVLATPFADAAGKVRAVIVTSDAPRPVRAVLLVVPGCTLRDPFGGERPVVEGARATLALPARGARLLLVDEPAR